MKNLSEITHELDVVTKKYVDNAAEAKVDKVEGKQLSTNDYTTEEKNKLNSLENYTLPAASADALGGVKIGNNLAIDENGVLNIDDIDYSELENKPTLNGVEISGNMTSEDLGLNSSNISYGSEEPTDENTVVWIDPNGTASSNGEIALANQYNYSNITHDYEKVDYITDIILSEELKQNYSFPTQWEITYGNGSAPTTTTYIAPSGEELTSYRTTGTYTDNAPYMFDTDENTSSTLYMYSSANRITINLKKLIKVTKFKIKIPYTNSSATIAFVGSNDGATWVELYTNIPVKTTTTLSEFEIPNPAYYSHYGVKVYSGSGNFTISVAELQFSEYYENPYFAIDKYILHLNNYTSNILQKGNFLYLQIVPDINFPTLLTNVYLQFEGFVNETLKINTRTMAVNRKYVLLFNGTNWDILDRPQEILHYIAPTKLDEIFINDINYGFHDGEKFTMLLYIDHNPNYGSSIYINEKTFLNITNANGRQDKLIVDCFFDEFNQELYIKVFDATESSLLYVQTFTSFNGVLQSIKIKNSTEGQQIYQNTSIRIFK